MCDHHHESGHDDGLEIHARCCPRPCEPLAGGAMSRRGFLGGATLGGAALAMASWSELAAAGAEVPVPPARQPLVVKPILTYAAPKRRPQWSWRSWGAIQTDEDAAAELGRIGKELEKLNAAADFPLRFLPPVAVRDAKRLDEVGDVSQADTILLYAAGGPAHIYQKLAEQGKSTVFFVRHQSGPVSLWYETVSPILIRGRTDKRVDKYLDDQDVVVDSLDGVLWRLRALCGLKNTLGSGIVAIGGGAGWGTPRAPELAKEKFQLQIQDVPYPELGQLIKAARGDAAAVALAEKRTAAYLKLPGTTLETERAYVVNAFLLEHIFRCLMQKANCRAITVNHCMGTIMPMSETTACLALSTLNDDGYLAFCESDFVVVPSGILLANIAGKPVFLNDPTYPHDGLITLAHCTGPRKMDGKNLEPARILTHFESDYGAAPKVDMRRGQITTNILPGFEATRWVGLLGEIVDAPFLAICRDQIDIRFKCDSRMLAERMPGFHWMTCYGDYSKELGYALKRLGIQWEFLG